MAIEDVVRIVESPVRLPAEFANQVYAAGESGMDYVIFTVVLSDGRALPYVTGNLVDFPALPPGVDTTDIAEVFPTVAAISFAIVAPILMRVLRHTTGIHIA